MTILHVSAVRGWGGGENHIESLCHELKESNPEIVNIVLCVKGDLFNERLLKTDIITESAPLVTNLDLRYIFKIISVCKKYKVDIIHLHDSTAMTLSIIADKFYNLPPFIFSKKTSFPIRKKKSTLFKYNHPKIKKIICVSNESKKVTEEAIVDLSKLTTVYQGTSLLNKSSETPFTLREKFSISTSKKIIGTIGNHVDAKNLEVFIETANIIINIKKRTDFIFVQIGIFTERTEELLKRVKELNLENDILFLGYTPNASNFIPQFDAFLLTSEIEGMPEVLFESFYHKKPVVSTNVGGIPEIIENGVNGFLTAPKDAKALAEKLIYLFENQDLISKFVDISYKKLIEKFTGSKMAQNTLKEYKKLLNLT
ncbi:glycosyltransferase family 4 protein [Flavobacterium sp.]